MPLENATNIKKNLDLYAMATLLVYVCGADPFDVLLRLIKTTLFYAYKY